MWVRKRLDIRWAHLGSALAYCLARWRRDELADDLEELWSHDGEAFACLSVRTGWDLYLQSLNLPRGSEVLVSAITIRDMVRIVEEHGLVPVPVDIDPRDLAVDMESLRRAITPKTRVILVAHLFGTRQPLEPILEIARQHNLRVVEDCAQAFAGLRFTGHPHADASLFSFGPIKTATALGGGVLTVRDQAVREQMQTLHAQLPVQSRGSFAKRVFKYGLMKLMSYWPLFGGLVWTMRALGRDPNQLVTGSVRGFPGADFFRLIRQQPCAPLLAMMHRRIAFFNRRELQRRTDAGRRTLALLRGTLRCPGTQSAIHSYWVFPVLHGDTARLIGRLQSAGYDASAAHSLSVVQPPADRPQQRATMAEAMLPRIVHLPCYPEMPDRELRRMTDTVRATARQQPAEVPLPLPSGEQVLAGG